MEKRLKCDEEGRRTRSEESAEDGDDRKKEERETKTEVEGGMSKRCADRRSESGRGDGQGDTVEGED